MLSARISETHLKLHGQRLGTEQVDHPRHPSLFLRRVLLLHHVRTLSPYFFYVFRSRTTHGVRLILDQHVTQVQDAVHISGRLNHGFVLEHARHDTVRNGAPRGKELLGEERNVARDGKQGKDGLVRVDWGYEQRCKISSGLRGVQIGAITHISDSRDAYMRWYNTPISILFDFAVRESQNLVHVFKPVRVTAEREIGEGDQECRDVLY